METLRTKTLNQMYNDSSDYDAIKNAENEILYKIKEPRRKTKPVLSTKHTTTEVEEYLLKLKEWEDDAVSYEEQRRGFHEQRQEVEYAILEYIKDKTSFNDVPEQYREKVWSKAYLDYDDYNHFYNKLTDLIDVFN